MCATTPPPPPLQNHAKCAAWVWNQRAVVGFAPLRAHAQQLRLPCTNLQRPRCLPCCSFYLQPPHSPYAFSPQTAFPAWRYVTTLLAVVQRR